MATTLQEVYTLFLSKIDEDLTGQESQIFAWLKSSIAKSKKYTSDTLDYILDVPTPPATESYDGSFTTTLLNDTIDLLAMQMQYERYNKKLSYYTTLSKSIGTKEFNQLEYKKELDGVRGSMALLKIDIGEMRQSFNDYKYV